MNEFWQSCVNRLEQEVPPQQMNAWIRPLVPLAYDESASKLRVCAPNRFKLDWVRKNFTNQIERFATEWYNRPVEVMFELPAGAANGAKPSQADADPSSHSPRGAAAALLPAPASRGGCVNAVQERFGRVPASCSGKRGEPGTTGERGLRDYR